MVNDDVEWSKMGRQGPRGVKGDVWGHRVGLTSLLIIQEAYLPMYNGSRLSLQAGGRTGGSIRGITRGPCGPKNSKNILFYFDD